jgi:hypothetical protein
LFRNREGDLRRGWWRQYGFSLACPVLCPSAVHLLLGVLDRIRNVTIFDNNTIRSVSLYWYFGQTHFVPNNQTGAAHGLQSGD